MGGGINSVMGYHSMFERSPGLGVVCGGARSYVLQAEGKVVEKWSFLCMILTIADMGLTCDIGWPST